MAEQRQFKMARYSNAKAEKFNAPGQISATPRVWTSLVLL